MIQPTKYDICIPKGATYDQAFTWKDINGSIFDLSLFTAAMQIRVSAGAPDPPTISLTTSNSGIILAATDPNISLFISAANTAAIPIASGVYDLEITDTDGIVTRLLEGKVKFSPEVTRD
jgi:hypothetical protein